MTKNKLFISILTIKIIKIFFIIKNNNRGKVNLRRVHWLGRSTYKGYNVRIVFSFSFESIDFLLHSVFRFSRGKTVFLFQKKIISKLQIML